ncbi:transporter substrate-binding domain-containing protein [Thalassococcus sp. S3]|uniref:transporter substrate-binding domain-containing protein n=1 Tax=Thalassococcus sp. S3 TaxID=2017482 RepID=UPI00102413AA|nr:transporter substrate-binding domain-containing protein [Thalassococcus sp. S3]QBF33086.1 ABC transporter substrate-binding protein [Thalassococcus sp. S3]
MRFAYIIEPPFNDRTGSGAVFGHDADLARHIFFQLGEDFEPVETTFAKLLPGLEKGNWQMTTGLFATPERARNAAFTRPVWALGDGLLVKRGNPLGLSGYRSTAKDDSARLAVIRDQVQERTARSFSMPPELLFVYDTYDDAAEAVRDGDVDAYASVNQAHRGYIERTDAAHVETIAVPAEEVAPGMGSFALRRSDRHLLTRVNEILDGYLGTAAHRDLAARYGFTGDDLDLLLSRPGAT